MRRAALAIAGIMMAFESGSAAAQQIPGPYGPPVTLGQARAIVDAAGRQAVSRNLLMAFTVALPSGEPILLEVMDGTQSASVAIAQPKARAAARFRRPTKAFGEALANGNLSILTIEGAVAVEGGLPIVAGGRVIGGLGVSGGTAAQDGEVATAALASARIK